MSWSDPIVDEVRRARDAYAARFNYDLRAIFRDLKEQEKRSGRKLASYAQEFAAEPDQALQPSEPAISVSPDSSVAGSGPAS
jgi:hypothetical protein